MKCDIVLAGVGGQGILTIAVVLDQAAVEHGIYFKQAEVHGMSQRGGDVYSHLRLGDKEIMSDLIPLGKADMILSLEPLEVQRYLPYLSRQGFVISNSACFKNIADYPPEESVLGALFKLKNCIVLDAKAVATKIGVPIAANMAMLGAALPFLPFQKQQLESVIRAIFERKGEQVVNANTRVLDAGYKLGLFYKALLECEIANETVFGLVSRLDVTTINPEMASQFVDAIRSGKGDLKQKISTLEVDLPCSPDGAAKLRKVLS